MPHKDRIVKPGRKERTVLTESGELLSPPQDWALLAPGDAALTKSVKAKGPTWLVRVKVGRRLMSKGIWAKEEHIRTAKKELELKRATPEYKKKRAQDLARKEKKHLVYVDDFFKEVVAFLDFHPRYKVLAEQLARSVTHLATPVGSGTVARTERIPLAERAGSAVIAWLRHQTTGYDRMTIARIKGRRRQVRRELAEYSQELLQRYREGRDVDPSCPLQKALKIN
jgi:hypothetical protein